MDSWGKQRSFLIRSLSVFLKPYLLDGNDKFGNCMLQYVRKYRHRAQYLTGILTLLLIGSVYLAMGPDFLANPMGWALMIAAFLIANYASARYGSYAATRHTQELLDIFDQNCDPKTFLEEGCEIAEEVMAQLPIKEWGASYLSDYCIALIDVGDHERATRYLGAIYKSAQSAENPSTKYGLLINLYAPTRDLFGFDLSEECLIAVENLRNENEKVARLSGAQYLAWARQLHNAAKAGLHYALIRLYEQVLNDDGQLMRIRVSAAYRIAAIYRELGDRYQEAVMLHYVIEHGNAMGCVINAQKYLARPL